MKFGSIRRIALSGRESVAQLGNTAIKKHKSIEEKGREAWRILHSERHGNAEWLASWVANHIPKGCGCSKSATTLFDLCPPRYDSPEEWFTWTVEFHNLVNKKLGKPIFSIDDAIAIWQRSETT